jgi:serine/threonine-protein phosphatase 2A regulatory subunit A
LRDKEAEVRTAACKVLAEVCAIVKTGLYETIGPCLEPLSVDTIGSVRVAFSKSLIPMCNLLGKETAQKLLVPMITQMCTDENADVRGNIVEGIDQVSELDQAGGGATIQSVIGSLMELSKDPKWRVRQAVIDKSVLLAKCVTVKNFDKKLQGIIIAALSDHVYSIRERACLQIGEVVKEYGAKWAAEKFFKEAFKIYDKNTNYLHRMTCLAVISSCAIHCNSEILEKNLLPLVLTACEDDVANVRIAGAKTMGDLLTNLDKSIASARCRPILTKMLKDTDVDVCFFSSQSLQKCS